MSLKSDVIVIGIGAIIVLAAAYYVKRKIGQVADEAIDFVNPWSKTNAINRAWTAAYASPAVQAMNNANYKKREDDGAQGYDWPI